MEDKILLDDDLVIETLNNIILSNKSSNLLIEGFPKTQNQAIIFEQLMGECSTLIELTAKPELLTKRILYKLGEQKGVTYTPEDINFRVNNYSTKMQSILSFYKGLGKLRRVDCAKSISEVYVEIRKAILSSVYFIIGVKGSGKTEVSKHYNSVMGMKIYNFEEWAIATKITDHDELLMKLVRELHADPTMKIGIEGFPKNLSELQFMILNGVNPSKVIYVNATEGKCILNSNSENITKNFKEFQHDTKELIDFCRKKDLLYEIINSEDDSIVDLKENAMKFFTPELIIMGAQGNMETELESTLKKLNEIDYLAIDYDQFEAQEILRSTRIGEDIKEQRQQKKRIPTSMKIELLKKIIYPTSETKRIILSKFPKSPEELEELEKQCCKVSSEFYLCNPENLPIDEPSLETYMHARGNLMLIETFSPELIDYYRGQQLQYALVVGPIASGKTTVSKYLGKLGFNYLEMEVITEEIKKRLATEDNPAENITVNFHQKLEELKSITGSRKSNDERFVIDGIDSEDFGSLKKIVTALGPPSDYIKLKCEPKEVKARYMKKNEVGELNEEDNAKIDKQIENYEKVKEDLSEVISELNGMHRDSQVTADGTEEEVQQNIRELFEPQIILLKSDDDPNINIKLLNLSLKYSFLYLPVPDLIKREIERKTPLGIELIRTKKVQENISDCDPYCSAHYEQKLICRLLKENINKAMGKYKTAIIYGYLSAYKLTGWEEQQQFRVMDELFNLEKELGAIRSVIDIVKDKFELVLNNRTPEKIKIKIKPVVKLSPGVEGEEKKEENEEPQENKGNVL